MMLGYAYFRKKTVTVTGMVSSERDHSLSQGTAGCRDALSDALVWLDENDQPDFITLIWA